MLYLASQSPRRAELLTRLGVDYAVLPIDVAERRHRGEAARDYVRRVAWEKAEAGLQQVRHFPGAVVLGADTEVLVDDETLGKPADADDAMAMLRQLSGRTHQVISAVSLVGIERCAGAMSVSTVTFAELHERDIAAYVASGDCMGKAGAYAIQGRAEAFVSRLEGSYSGVVGLPLHETARLLALFALGPLYHGEGKGGNR